MHFLTFGCRLTRDTKSAKKPSEFTTTNVIPMKLESYVGFVGSSVINNSPPNNVNNICKLVKKLNQSSTLSTNGPTFNNNIKLVKTINNAMANCAEDPGAIMVIAPVSNIFLKMTITSQYQYSVSLPQSKKRKNVVKCQSWSTTLLPPVASTYYCKYKVPNLSTTA